MESTVAPLLSSVEDAMEAKKGSERERERKKAEAAPLEKGCLLARRGQQDLAQERLSFQEDGNRCLKQQ